MTNILLLLLYDEVVRKIETWLQKQLAVCLSSSTVSAENSLTLNLIFSLLLHYIYHCDMDVGFYNDDESIKINKQSWACMLLLWSITTEKNAYHVIKTLLWVISFKFSLKFHPYPPSSSWLLLHNLLKNNIN